MNRTIKERDKRRLYAESMGRCMNPACKEGVLTVDVDIIEKAHIVPYSQTGDNSFDNLIILCPNCHTKFDKHIFTVDEVKSWKQTRREELEKMFATEFETFDGLKEKVIPLLNENKAIYENYYLNDEKKLWDKFESKILINNAKLRNLIEKNYRLFQNHENEEYSNLAVAKDFIAHINEFQETRVDCEKFRKMIFPEKINSIFGITRIKDSILPSTESLECFLRKMQEGGKTVETALYDEEPYIVLEGEKIFLDDTPRLRQLYFDYDCFLGTGIRLKSLCFIMKYLRTRGISFRYKQPCNLHEIFLGNRDIHVTFTYEYCLSRYFLEKLCPSPGDIVVNLHNWNGARCISKEAYNLAKKLDISLFTSDDFYVYVKAI